MVLLTVLLGGTPGCSDRPAHDPGGGPTETTPPASPDGPSSSTTAPSTDSGQVHEGEGHAFGPPFGDSLRPTAELLRDQRHV